MSYLVTHKGRRAAIGPVDDIHAALAIARQLLAELKPDIAIQDGVGREISGADLIACCKGEKTLSADLRAMWPAEICILPS